MILPNLKQLGSITKYFQATPNQLSWKDKASQSFSSVCTKIRNIDLKALKNTCLKSNYNPGWKGAVPIIGVAAFIIGTCLYKKFFPKGVIQKINITDSKEI